jgi:hypothetical protein
MTTSSLSSTDSPQESKQEGLQRLAKPSCWDCGKRVGVVPALWLKEPEDKILRICVRCYNRWRPFMHPDGCSCDHCQECGKRIQQELEK